MSCCGGGLPNGRLLADRIAAEFAGASAASAPLKNLRRRKNPSLQGG